MWCGKTNINYYLAPVGTTSDKGRLRMRCLSSRGLQGQLGGCGVGGGVGRVRGDQERLSGGGDICLGLKECNGVSHIKIFVKAQGPNCSSERRGKVSSARKDK